MKRVSFILILIAHLFSGCSLFQKTKTSSSKFAGKTQEESTKTAQLMMFNQSIGWSLSRKDDSLNSSSVVVIWPKGKFNFSPSSGFSGTAEKIVISERLKSGSKVQEEKILVEEQARSGTQTEAYQKSVSTNQKETTKERFPVSGWWYFLLLIPLVLALRWGYQSLSWKNLVK